MLSIPKDKPYRNQFLRDIAVEAPICFRCGQSNDGTVVGCHSNAIADGHGTGQKASDLLAYMDRECHRWVDTHWHDGGQEEFYYAAYKSTIWLLKEGYLVTK